MKKLLGIVVLGLIFFNIVLADSSLPNCKGTDAFKWTNCFGTEEKSVAYDQLYKDKYKDKKILYQGEYRNGKLHGKGSITFTDGIKCKIGSKSLKDQDWPNGHDIDQAECFQYYNPVIKEYIASRIK